MSYAEIEAGRLQPEEKTMRRATAAWRDQNTGQWVLGLGWPQYRLDDMKMYLADDIANGDMREDTIIVRLPRKFDVSKLLPPYHHSGEAN